MDHSTHDREDVAKPAFRGNVVLIAFLAIAGFYLVVEHRAHAMAYWPWLFLMACPLLHMFMHGGHGGHGGQRSRESGTEGTPSRPSPPTNADE